MFLTRRSVLFTSLGLLGLTLATGIAPAAGRSAAQPMGSEPTSASITTIGEGFATATPDRARLALVVEAIEPSIGAAQTKVGRQVAAVRQALQARGVAPGDIRTAHYAIGPRHERKEPQPNPSGYFATYVLEVEAKDIQGLGPLLDAAVDAGVTRVDGVQFQVGDPHSALAVARSAALKDAREKADQIARESGVSLRGVVRIEEGDGQAAPIARLDFMPGAERMRAVLRVSWSVQ